MYTIAERLRTKLRFKVGDRVECNYKGSFSPGVIVKCWYEAPKFEPGMAAPYQIKLDTGVLIFSNADTDGAIRKETKRRSKKSKASPCPICAKPLPGPCGNVHICVECDRQACCECTSYCEGSRCDGELLCDDCIRVCGHCNDSICPECRYYCHLCDQIESILNL